MALIHGQKQFTYAMLRESVESCAASLVARGGVAGERIAILSENSPFWVISYLAVIRAGCIAVPFECGLGPGSFNELVRTAGMRLVLVSPRFEKKVRAWQTDRPVEVCSELEPGGDGVAITPSLPADMRESDPAVIVFTSGSTGRPKGVMVTHRNIEANTRDIIEYMGLTAEDRVMVVLPFHYCYGASLLHSVLMAGGTLVLNNDFKLFPEAVLQDMERTHCTGFAGVPSTYQILLRRSRFKTMKLPSLRWLQQAGGKLPNACIQEIRESFPQVRFYTMYGQTEATARLSYLPPERLTDKLGSIGKGLPSTRLQVVHPDGRLVKPGSDETGELIAQGPNISSGYWNDPVETAKFFKDGWLHTGDIARVDEDGFIYIMDRQRDFIKSGGNRVSAKEVEEVISEIQQVVEVAVVGGEHELLGEAIHAFIVPAPGSGLGPEAIMAYCSKRLPAFKMPEIIHLVTALPHNHSGKVMKEELKQSLCQDPSSHAVAASHASRTEDRQPGKRVSPEH